MGKLAGKKKPADLSERPKRGRKAKIKFPNGAVGSSNSAAGPSGVGPSTTTEIDKSSKVDDEPQVETKMILCSANDDFVLSQDLCVMCGSLGVGAEGRLIACSQCGQAYHPYCVNIRVNKVI